MIKYTKVTVYFEDKAEPMVVRDASRIARSRFPGSGDPALQIIKAPSKPMVETLKEGLFDLELNLARPSNIDYLVLQEGKERRTVELKDLFEEWDWKSS